MADVKRVQQQIMTLAHIHDILTHNSGIAREPTDEVSVRAMLTRLLSMLKTSADRYRFEQEIEDVCLSVQQATCLGLVLNELTSNALKHGRHSVRVTFRAKGQAALLTVEDDGPGLPAGFDYRAQANTGLALVDHLVHHDLRGILTFSNREQGGARVTVSLPIAK